MQPAFELTSLMPVQVAGPGLLDTAAIAGILDTAPDLPDHPEFIDAPCIRPGRLPASNDAHSPAAVRDTATSIQALLSTQQHESLQQWRQESHRGPSHEAQEASAVPPPAIILEPAASSANPRATQQQTAVQNEQQLPVQSDMAGEAPSPAAAALRPLPALQPAATVTGLLPTQQQEDLQQWQAGPAHSFSQEAGSSFQPLSLAQGASPLISTLQHEDLQQWHRETDPALQPVYQHDMHQPAAPGHDPAEQAEDVLHHHQHTSQPADAERPHEHSGARSAAAGVIAEPAASPPHPIIAPAVPGAEHAAGAAPRDLPPDVLHAVLPSRDTSGMTGGMLATQHAMLDTATSIQGLLSTQQHADMQEDAGVQYS